MIDRVQERSRAQPLAPALTSQRTRPLHMRPGPLPFPLSGRIEDLPTQAPEPPSSPLTEWGNRITRAEPDPTTGAALTAWMEEQNPQKVASYGVSLLTVDQAYGTETEPGLCEDGRLLFEFTDGDTRWEAGFDVPSQMTFVSDPALLYSALSGVCQRALANNGGDIEAAVAAEDCYTGEEQAFFPLGSDCRACVEEAGDWDACVEAGTCEEEAPQQGWVDTDAQGQPVWWQIATAYLWSCAPSWWSTVLLLVKPQDNNELPEPWDHAGWGYICLPFWDEAARDANFICVYGLDSPETGDALGEGALGRISWLRPEGSEGDDHADRMWYSSAVSISAGPTIHYFWNWSDGGAGVVSMPPPYGWGLNPSSVRPDGDDPSALDDTYARDWVGALAVKTATTRDGVPIGVYVHSRCPDDAWEGPDARGAWTCTRAGERDEAWPQEDNNAWWASESQVYVAPMATLGSTGLPDPQVPGGYTIHVAGTRYLADEDWDACAWPNTFEPDLVRYEDNPDDPTGPASLWGHTYKFGKDPNQDLRIVLNTNQLRGFCPEGQ